jgi:hypothetical protein
MVIMLFFNRFNLCLLFIVIFPLLIFGCGESGHRDDNFAPRIFTFEAESDIVEPGAQVAITLNAGDLEGDTLTFEWSATGGSIDGDDSGAVWTAPKEERKYQIGVTVSDGAKSITSTIDIQVWRTRPGDYYPLAVGNIWRYRDDEGNLIEFEIVDKIQINLRSGKLVKSFVLQKSSKDNEELKDLRNFSYIGQEFDENGKVKTVVQHAQNITTGTNDTMLFTPFLPLYNFPLIPKNKWMVHFKAEVVPELFPLGNGVDEFEVLSEETVSVPAGVFENVFQVQESFRWEFFDRELDETIVQKWLAPDVGIIKFTQAQTRADVTVNVEFKLESYELVTE